LIAEYSVFINKTKALPPKSAVGKAQLKEILMSNATKTFSAANMALANSIVQQLDVLSVRRKEWEATDYKKSNDGLCSLLADSLGIFKESFVKADEKAQKAFRVQLRDRLTADGIRVVKTSTTLTMLARFVFNSDRKRAQGYGYVLAAAVSHGIETTDFSAWVAEQGGIEEIKRKMVKSAKAQAKQAAVETAKVSVKDELELNTLQPLARVNVEGLTGNYAVLLAKPNVGGGVDVIGSLGDINDALVNALILRMAKHQVEKATADAELGRQIAKEHGDMLAFANHEQKRKVING
jgi:hypothetical protein